MRSPKRFVCALAALAFASATCTLPAFADERDDLVRQQQQQRAAIEQYQSSLEGVDTQLQQVYLQLQETQAKIPEAQAALLTAQGELAAATREQEMVAAQLQSAQAQLNSIGQELSSGERQISVSRSELGEIVRAQYRGNTLPTTLDMLAGSSSSEEFLNALAASRTALRKQTAALTLLQQSTADARNRHARQSAVEDTVAELKQRADSLVQEKAAKENEASQKAQELADIEAQYAQQSANLQTQRAAFEASIAQANAAINSTASQIAAIDAENRRRAAAAAASAASQASNSSRQNSSGSSNGGGSNYSGFLIPVIRGSLYVTSPFGMRNYPFGGYWMHNGVDLRSACGSEQIAPGNGTIARVVPAAGNSTHGNQIFINLGVVNGHSWVVVTNHLSGFNVRAGQQVRQGDVIGWTGRTGQVTGCHVHMEVWRDGSVINPMSLF